MGEKAIRANKMDRTRKERIRLDGFVAHGSVKQTRVDDERLAPLSSSQPPDDSYWERVLIYSIDELSLPTYKNEWVANVIMTTISQAKGNKR